MKATTQKRLTQPFFHAIMVWISAILVVFAIAFEIVLLQHFEKHVTDDARKSISELSEDMHVTFRQQALGMSMALQNVIQDRATRHYIKEGNADKLKETWQALFEHLRDTNGITHFSFFDAQHIALLRLQRDERNDKVVRHNLLEAERSKTMEWGVEIGQTGLFVLRTLVPVLEDEKIIGYVELGKNIEDVFYLLHVNLSSHFIVLIDKAYVDKHSWETYAKKYQERFAWEKFPKSAVVFASRNTFPDALALKGRNEALEYNEINFDAKTWVMYQKPLPDSSGNHIGDILVMHDITADKEAFIRFGILSSTIGLLLVLFIVTVIYILLARTDKRIRQEELKTYQSEEKIRALAIQSRTVFWEIDAQGVFTYVSDIMNSLSGYCFDELVGKMSFLELYSKKESQGFEDRARWIFDLKEPFVNKEDKLITKEGKPLWVLTNAIPHFSASGEFLGYRGSSTDITNRKLAEEAQKEANERIQKIASRIPGMVYQYKLMKDGRSCFPYASAAIYDIYRVTPEEVRLDATKVFDVLHPDDREGIVASIQKSAQTLNPWRYEYRVKFEDEVRWLFGNALPEMQVDGSILWHGFIHDITERKMMEEELKALNEQLDKRVEEEMQARLKIEREQEIEREFLIQKSKLSSMGEMMGAIAHQWRQPLNALNLNIQNLDDDFADGLIDKAFIDAFIAKNRQTILFMSKTIDDFRNFFKIDKAKKKFGIREAIEETLSLQSAQFKNRNIMVDIHGENDTIEGFRGEFQQVVLNIINNAKDAILERKIKEGRITITITPLHVSIEDNAGGIEAEVLDRVFEPYFTTKDQGDGTGIGLYMSKMIIEKNMSGKLIAENGTFGARFVIYYPLKEEGSREL